MLLACWLRCRTASSSAGQLSNAFQFVQIARPVILKQPRERPIREDTALGLTTRAIVGLVISVADSLPRCGTDRATLAMTAMHSHLGIECSNLLREVVACLKAKPIDPFPEHYLGSVEQPPDVVLCELLRER